MKGTISEAELFTLRTRLDEPHLQARGIIVAPILTKGQISMTTYYQIIANPKASERQLFSHRERVWRPMHVCDGDGESYGTQRLAEFDIEAARTAWGEYADLASIRIEEITVNDQVEV